MEIGRNLVLVTGATGQQGGAVARELLAKGHQVRAMTRDPQKAAARELAKLGAEVVKGDLEDAASLERAANGAWGAFAVQNNREAGLEGEEEQGKRFAEVARKAGIQHLVYTSVASAHRKTGIPHFENKARIEEKVRGLGFPSYTILRPVFFMENFTSPSFVSPIQKGQLALGIKPETVLQMIAVQDIGKYGAWAFERDADLNRLEIDIAGDQLAMPAAATILSKTLGHPVTHFQVPIEEVRQFSADFATMLDWFDRVGYDADIPKNSRESGIRPTTFAEWAAKAQWAPAAASR